jgi:hypothetical protein
MSFLAARREMGGSGNRIETTSEEKRESIVALPCEHLLRHCGYDSSHSRRTDEPEQEVLLDEKGGSSPLFPPARWKPRFPVR